MSSWSDGLPDDILLLIAKKVINGYDFMSFSQVCSSWRSIAKQEHKRFHPVPPGILGFKSESISCFDFYESLSKLKRWPEFRLPRENVVCGSHQGWIVMREPDSYEELVLINPVTQVRSKLPYISASKIIFSANPMDYNNCYYIIADPREPLRCCKLGDTGWTVVEISGEENAPFEVVSAIYCRGKLYALRITGELFVCDDITASPPMMTKLVNIPPYSRQNIALEFSALLDEAHEKFFLVESGEELLLVYRKEECYLSALWEVYRLDVGGLRWDRVTNLGGHALFLGKTQSFSLSELDVRGIKGNHIYYPKVDSCLVFKFNLENSWIEFLIATTEESQGIWFMPQFF